ncbi:MAG: UDP-N-acetylmuramate dehydrogenase [Chitinophagaceae bacterium]|nr:UDP-N-acetylmuramate dehydrogenase [Chitinophagaceae bacterium]
MESLSTDISLAPFNSFGIKVKTRWYGKFCDAGELTQIINSSPRVPKLVLGGGSNLLFTKDFEGLVLKNEIMGIQKTSEDENFVYLKVGAGENWHRFVMYCIENNYAGVENLSLIPGCVGASPMQNIGAYGVELKDVFHELTAFHIEEKSNYTFRLKDCQFGYRDSVFKGKYRNQFVILHVTFRLNKKPVFHTGYGAIEQELAKMDVKELSIRAISNAVINIRTSKLPDPLEIGNAGSFYKNPSVSKEKFQQLKTDFPDAVGYDNADGSVKLAAGWLIEHSGPDNETSWKGYRLGDAGVHPLQALVLVNYGNATGQEVYDLSERILQSVHNKFGVTLEREVNII